MFRTTCPHQEHQHSLHWADQVAGQVLRCPIFPETRPDFKKKDFADAPIFLLGVHAKAGADVVDILQDLSNNLTFAPQRSCFVAVGDWNLDAGISVMHLSPPTEADRFLHPSGAIQIDNWLAMNAFLRSREWALKRPTTMVQAQQFNLLYDTGAIFTHVPRGAQADHAAPSLIDWCIRSSGLSFAVWCSWSDTPADHAFVVVDAEFLKLKLPKRPKTTWTCTDPRRMTTALAARRLKLDSLVEAVAGLRSAMIVHADRTLCHIRRSAREPWRFKQLRQALNSAPDECTRNALRKNLIAARCNFFCN
jgi:hypothetical protein